MSEDAPLLLLALFYLHGADIPLFETYERAVLPLLGEHGGVLRFRIRSSDNTLEAHLIEFSSRTAWNSFREDGRRRANVLQLNRSGVRVELREMRECELPSKSRS